MQLQDIVLGRVVLFFDELIKGYLQSELDMPGEFVESKIKYYKMRRDVYAKGGCGEIHLGVSST